MRRLAIPFSLILAVTFLASGAQAEWQRGRLFGADVRSMVIDPRNPDVLYLGTSDGEVYVSRDGAASWNPTRAGVPFPGYVVDNLLIDGKGRLWAAAWGLWKGGVIAVSGDGGKSWSRRDAGLEEFSVRALAIDPKNPDGLVAGGLTGVHRTSDGGMRWKKISDQENVESVAIDPRNPNRIYIGTWRQAWRTDDGGATWKHIAEGMVLDTDVFAINIDPKNPDDIWLSTCGWVYNSKNIGDKWTRYKEGFENRRIHTIERDPFQTKTLYAGSVAGLYCSTNGGESWSRISDDTLVINSIIMHPDRPSRIILGTEGDGVYVSRDGGKSWNRSSEGLFNVRVSSVVADPSREGVVYAAVKFGGSSSGVYESRDGGRSWSRMSKTPLPEILSLTVLEGVEPRYVVGTEKGFFWSSDGKEWVAAEPAAFPVRVEEIVVYSSSRLFAATIEGVFTSRDSGRSWYRLGGSHDRVIDIALGRWNGEQSLYALTASGVELFDGRQWKRVSASPAGGHSLAVRSDGAGDVVVVAGANGVKAGRVGPLGEWKSVAAPPMQSAAVLQARDLTLLSPRSDYRAFIAESESDWRSLVLPTDASAVSSIASDPHNRGRFYLATFGQGLFVWENSTGQRMPTHEIQAGGSK